MNEKVNIVAPIFNTNIIKCKCFDSWESFLADDSVVEHTYWEDFSYWRKIGVCRTLTIQIGLNSNLVTPQYAPLRLTIEFKEN